MRSASRQKMKRKILRINSHLLAQRLNPETCWAKELWAAVMPKLRKTRPVYWKVAGQPLTTNPIIKHRLIRRSNLRIRASQLRKKLLMPTAKSKSIRFINSIITRRQRRTRPIQSHAPHQYLWKRAMRCRKIAWKQDYQYHHPINSLPPSQITHQRDNTNRQ